MASETSAPGEHAPAGPAALRASVWPFVGAWPAVIAHRGASGYRPEHGRAAYELAIALGADAVEPDLVPTRDGVLVVRHENEISETTDVAQHPQFASRRTTKVIDGVKHTGWFTEDFTWAELRRLRTRERLPGVRPNNTAFDGADRMLRLPDLLRILDAADRPVGVVLELKHATYFERIGLPLDELVERDLRAAGWWDDERVLVESFEARVLRSLRRRGLGAPLVYLVEASGAPADRVEKDGRAAAPYADDLTPSGLDALRADGMAGISVSKHLLLPPDAAPGAVPATDLVGRAHAAGLLAFTWTLRAENRFLARAHRRDGGKERHGDWLGEFQRLMGTGVDAVFADQPDLAIEARSRR